MYNSRLNASLQIEIIIFFINCTAQLEPIILILAVKMCEFYLNLFISA